MKEIEKYYKQNEDGTAQTAVLLIAKADCYIVKTITGEDLTDVEETVHLTHAGATRAFNTAKNKIK